MILVAGCRSTPSTPKADPDKYTFQVIGVEIPEKVNPYKTGEFSTIEEENKLLSHPDAEIVEYPIVIAGPGDTVVNDQTESASFPEDYAIVDGKAVAKEKSLKLGYSVSVQLTEVKNEIVKYHLNTYYKELVGYDEHEIGDGITVKMPYFKSRILDVDLSHKANTWIILGGLVDERSDGTKISLMIAVRIIPPMKK